MTLPDMPSQQDQINAASRSSPLGERLQLLHDNGHGWLDPQLQTTLAQSSTSDQQMLGAASQASTTIIQQLSQAGRGALSAVRTVFDDPVLHKQPSAALAIHQFLTQQAGWMPVEAPDLSAIQRSLQAQGYGKGLAVSGVWTPDWQNIYYTKSQDHLDARRTSNDGMGFSFAHALKGFLNSIMPSHAIPALVGAAKALPGDIRSMISDNVAHLVDLPHELTKNPLNALNYVNPAQQMIDTYGSKQRGSAAATVGAGIESLGNHRTITPVEFDSEHGFHRMVESINTILTVLPVMRLGSTVADAGGQAIARGLFTDMGEGAAQRGPGLISNMVYRPAGYQTVDGEAQLIGDRGLLALKSFDNIPGLKQMLPPLRNATSKGQRYWYYEARPWAASLYRMPIVTAAGHVYTQATFTGAMIRGDANVVNRIEGGHSNLANTVFAQKPYTGPLGFALDLSSAVAHGEMPFRAPIAAKTADEALTAAAKAKAYEPLVLPSLSQQIGDTVRGAHQVYDAMLGRIGVIGAWERGTGLKYKDTLAAVRAAGLDSTDLHWHAQAKVDEFAAHDAAEQLNRTSGELGVQHEQDHLATAAAIRDDPEALGSARALLMDSPARLTTRFRQDATRISQRAEARTGDLISLMKGRRIAYSVLNDPRLASQLIHPGTFQAIKDARDEAQFNAHLGMQEAPPKVVANREFLTANNPTPNRGGIGLGRTDSLTQPEALSKINRLASSFRAAGGLASGRAAALTTGNIATTTLPAIDRAAINTHLEAAAKLALQMHMDPAFLPHEPETVLNVLRERANHLAVPVAIPLDAPAELTGAVTDLRNLGLRLVAGTGIGFDLVPPVIDPVVVDGGVRTIRKVANMLGVSSTYADPEDVALQHRMDWIKRLQGRADKGQLPDYPGWTWDHVLRHVYDNLPNRKTLGGVAGGVFKFQDRRWQKIVRAILPADATEQDVTEKIHVLEEQLAQQKSILDTPYKDFVKAATSPAKGLVNFATGTAEAEPLFTDAQAKLMYLDMLRAAGDKQMWLAGASKLDGLKRAGFSFLGQPAANNKTLMRVATLPNNLVRFRNKFRFEIDPEFAARRQFKQGLKLSMSQVPYTMTPFDSMVKQGTLRSDIQWAERNFPEYHKNLSTGWDTNDQALYDSDVLGIYNPRHWIAYGGGWFKRMGMSDTQAKDAVTKALTYGSRTALERSVGTIFYPFSFEKTLYRQLGTYLIDNPGQRFLVDAATQAYDVLNQHAHIGQWIQDRLPILKELDRLNAFDHGVGPGMIGGIDAPYARLVWNLFGPQHIQQPNDKTATVIQSAIPLFGELNRMLLGYSPYSGTAKGGGLLEQQAKVTFAAAIQGKDDVERWITGRSPSPWSPPPPALDYKAQQEQAWQMRTMLISKLAGTIDYNYHHPNGEVTIADDPSVPGDLRGKPITRATIDEIVHRFYPDYDPTAAQSTAVTKKTERDRAIGQLADRNPSLADLYGQFAVSADKFITYKQRREFTPDQMATLRGLSNQYRAYAVAVSETDPAFLRFYNAYFASQLGPIEEVTN